MADLHKRLTSDQVTGYFLSRASLFCLTSRNNGETAVHGYSRSVLGSIGVVPPDHVLQSQFPSSMISLTEFYHFITFFLPDLVYILRLAAYFAVKMFICYFNGEENCDVKLPWLQTLWISIFLDRDGHLHFPTIECNHAQESLTCQFFTFFRRRSRTLRSVCRDPKILLPWQREVTTFPLCYARSATKKPSELLISLKINNYSSSPNRLWANSP